jgi:hypothetical protein
MHIGIAPMTDPLRVTLLTELSAAKQKYKLQL